MAQSKIVVRRIIRVSLSFVSFESNRIEWAVMTVHMHMLTDRFSSQKSTALFLIDFIGKIGSWKE